eukprot:SAG11_NODE_466_length_9212_cov_2.301986_2_plen_105_part_00
MALNDALICHAELGGGALAGAGWVRCHYAFLYAADQHERLRISVTQCKTEMTVWTMRRSDASSSKDLDGVELIWATEGSRHRVLPSTAHKGIPEIGSRSVWAVR